MRIVSDKFVVQKNCKNWKSSTLSRFYRQDWASPNLEIAAKWIEAEKWNYPKVDQSNASLQGAENKLLLPQNFLGLRRLGVITAEDLPWVALSDLEHSGLDCERCSTQSRFRTNAVRTGEIRLADQKMMLQWKDHETYASPW